MTETREALDRMLHDAVLALDDRFADAESAAEVYRALANTVWRLRDGPEGHVSLSWSRAEALVNELRARHAQEPLELAQTGGEGDVSARIAEALGASGWTAQPLNTSRHDEQHAGETAESPPPPGQGERMAPVGDSGEWSRVGHAEADRATGRLAADEP
jgi:hypothetical protein